GSPPHPERGRCALPGEPEDGHPLGPFRQAHRHPHPRRPPPLQGLRDPSLPRRDGPAGPLAAPVALSPPPEERGTVSGLSVAPHAEPRPHDRYQPMATPPAAFSLRLHLRLANRPGTLGLMATRIGEIGGNITAIGGFDVRGSHLDEEIIVNCSSEEHIQR